MSQPLSRRPIMAVIGTGGVIDPPLEALAEELGQRAIDAGFRIVTGGLCGVMAAASRGARTSAAWREGDILGMLPTYDRETANPFVDVVIPTGLGIGRNVLVVATADVVVALGGSSGTLSELAIAWQLGRPIVGIEPSGGWAADLGGRRIDDRRADVIHKAKSPAEAVAKALELIFR